MAIMGKCLSREINLYTTKEGYSFDNSINSKVLCFAFGLVAEIERNLISMRTKEALALRKAEGVTLGRRKRQLYQDEYLDGQPTGDNRDAQQRQVDRRYLQTFRHIARYVRQIPEKISVRAEGGSGEGGKADCCVWRYEVFFPSGLTIEGTACCRSLDSLYA